MSSPFSWFRKRQKLLLGIFGVLLIFVFTISLGSGVDPLVDLLSGNWQAGSAKGPVVVSWRDGKLHEQDLYDLRTQRRLAAGYVQAVYEIGGERGSQPRELPLDRGLDDQSLFLFEMLASQARQMGLTISDNDIKDYLHALTDGRLEEWELSEIWKNFTGNQYSDSRLFDLLRRELAAHRVREMLFSSITSPIQRWDMFDRMERRVSVEMMPIEVDSFLDEVPEPSERELQEFFALHKSRFANPGDPTPGFRQRERRAFEFVRFDQGAVVEDEIAKVTDAEVREYYEQNKDEFIQTTLPASDLTPDASDVEAGGQDATTDTVPAEETAVEMEDEEVTEEPAPEPPTPTETPVPQEEAAAPPQEEVAAPAVPEDDPTTDVASDLPTTQDATPPTPPNATDSTANRFQPLEEVEAEIRRRLAAPRAQRRLDEMIAKTQQRIGKYLQWHRTNPDSAQSPPEIPWSEISPDLPLSIETIPLGNEIELTDEELGRQIESIERDGQIRWVPFGQFGFDPSLEPYNARLIPSQPYAWPKFLFWLTHKEPAYEPSLQEIHDEVVVAWKRRRALELAKADAEAAMTKVKDSGKPLSEALVDTGRTFLGPVDVRWMSMGNFPSIPNGRPQPVEIPGVDWTTYEMLQTIFRMEPGDVAALTNAPGTTVYVVRAIESEPSADVRRAIFLRGGGADIGVRELIQSELQEELRASYIDMLHNQQVEWHRDPDALVQ